MYACIGMEYQKRKSERSRLLLKTMYHSCNDYCTNTIEFVGRDESSDYRLCNRNVQQKRATRTYRLRIEVVSFTN